MCSKSCCVHVPCKLLSSKIVRSELRLSGDGVEAAKGASRANTLKRLRSDIPAEFTQTGEAKAADITTVNTAVYVAHTVILILCSNESAAVSRARSTLDWQAKSTVPPNLVNHNREFSASLTRREGNEAGESFPSIHQSFVSALG